ncbi:hypothetical protein A2U01_0069950, partial [Trifolium medium]|nr:hypothetical protein [Trifolium medium]
MNEVLSSQIIPVKAATVRRWLFSASVAESVNNNNIGCSRIGRCFLFHEFWTV